MRPFTAWLVFCVSLVGCAAELSSPDAPELGIDALQAAPACTADCAGYVCPANYRAATLGDNCRVDSRGTCTGTFRCTCEPTNGTGGQKNASKTKFACDGTGTRPNGSAAVDIAPAVSLESRVDF